MHVLFRETGNYDKGTDIEYNVKLQVFFFGVLPLCHIYIYAFKDSQVFCVLVY